PSRSRRSHPAAPEARAGAPAMRWHAECQSGTLGEQALLHRHRSGRRCRRRAASPGAAPVRHRYLAMVPAFTVAVQINRLFSTAAFGLMALRLSLVGYSRMLWLIDYAEAR